MIDGFLPGSRANFMMDVIVLAMTILLPLMIYSIVLVRKRRAFKAHKTIQTTIGLILLVAVLLFEWDVRTHDWRPAASISPFYDSFVMPLLWVHVAFAVSATIMWTTTLGGALRRFVKPPSPGPYSGWHRRLGHVTAVVTVGTTVTGWIFYAVAFVAT